MANDFYTRNADFNPDEIADGDAIEAEFDAVQRGFDEVETEKQDKSDKLSALVGLVWSANQLPYISGANAMALAPISAFVRSILNGADASAFKTAIGAQPVDALLTALAALTTSADKLPYFTGADTVAQTALTSFARTLLDDADAATARATLSAAESSVTMQGANSSKTSLESSSPDTIVKSGPYSIDPAATNNPWSGTWSLLTHVEHVQQNGYGIQFASPVGSNAVMKMRKKNASALYPWKNIWTEDSLAYETGTFTPYVYGIATAGVATYAHAVGRYTKIGNRVHITISLSFSSFTGAGAMRVGGLPFFPANVTNQWHPMQCYHENITFTGAQLTAQISVNQNWLALLQVSSGSYLTFNCVAAGVIRVNGIYEV